MCYIYEKKALIQNQWKKFEKVNEWTIFLYYAIELLQSSENSQHSGPKKSFNMKILLQKFVACRKIKLGKTDIQTFNITEQNQ